MQMQVHKYSATDLELSNHVLSFREVFGGYILLLDHILGILFATYSTNGIAPRNTLLEYILS
jgi:hypothetical protein